jgi:dinuclear metal center YbgI/SA1388 family protein
MVESSELVSYIDEYLRVKDITDYARNGLQVQCPEVIERAGFAVDASMSTFSRAEELSVDLLFVHHGLFWKDVQMVVGVHFERMKKLLGCGIGLYAAHLPLDAHEEVGNNVQLAGVLGMADLGAFGMYEGVEIGRLAIPSDGMSRDEVLGRLNHLLSTECLLLPFGPEKVGRTAIVSGGGGSLLSDAIDAGCDTFVTGEQEHGLYHLARDSGVNVFMAGHYATETVGVKALQKHLSDKFDIDTEFIDMPTGM